MKYTSYTLDILFYSVLLFSFQVWPAYVIGLMQVRNEADIIEPTLRALALHTDGIIVLDDYSEDNTLNKLYDLMQELNIIKIISNEKSEWIYGSEVNNRQKLLDIGRQYGGTHFIELDADEVLTTHCADNNWLRNKLLSLKKGQILQLPLVNLWKSFDYYRSKFTDNFPDICYCTIGYCDDGVSDLSYNLVYSHANFLHFGRFPTKYPAHYPLFVYEADINHSVIHLPFVNWDNVIIKKVWIMMLEIIRLEEKLYNKKRFPHGRTIQDIEKFYEAFHNYDNEDIELSPTPSSWLNYTFFTKEPYLKKFPHAKLKEIRAWANLYGNEYFNTCNYLNKHLPSLLVDPPEYTSSNS